MEELREFNFEIHPLLQDLVRTPFFRTFKINIERECPFWASARMCTSHKCGVCECDENEIPHFWKEQ